MDRKASLVPAEISKTMVPEAGDENHVSGALLGDSDLREG